MIWALIFIISFLCILLCIYILWIFTYIIILLVIFISLGGFELLLMSLPFNLKYFLQCFLKGQFTSRKLPQALFNLEYIFNLHSLLKNSFDGYKILNCHNLFSSFFFSTLNMLSLCSLTLIVFDEKSIVNHSAVPLLNKSFFFCFCQEFLFFFGFQCLTIFCL